MTNEKSSTSTQSAPHINRLFARFGVIYGHIWQSQFKPASFLALAKKEWSETLNSIEEKNMELAINECKKRIEMPPTLPQFYQLCRNFQANNKVQLIKNTQKTRSNPVIAIQNIKEMKKKLGQKIKES